MDEEGGRIRTPASSPGGTVEPAARAAAASAKRRKAIVPGAVRYELHDPTAEVTYRSTKQAEIIAKAAKMGSTIFVAIDAQGRRTPVRQIDGAWRPQATLPPREAVLDAVVDDESRGKRPPLDAGERPVPDLAHAGRERGLDAESANRATQATANRKSARADAEAERALTVARLEAALSERYVIRRAAVMVNDVAVGRMEYRYRGDTTRVAFTESAFKLATDTNNPSVARSMVDVAEARNWKALRVSGNDEFRRLVWLEATVRGVKTFGYEPSPTDIDLAHKEREARAVNRIEPARQDARPDARGEPAAASAPAGDKASARGDGGRKTVLAAIEAVLVANRVPAARREAVIAAAADHLALRMREDRKVEVKLYDKAAPSHRTPAVPTPEVQRTRERATPAPAR